MFYHLQAKMPFDANKLYGSEILAILLQNSDGKKYRKYDYIQDMIFDI